MKNDSNVQDQINKLALCLEDVSRWMLQNRLKLNPSKTEIILFRSPRSRSTIDNVLLLFEGNVIIGKNSLKSLGVTLDPYMKLDKHVTKLASSAWFKLRSISRIRNQINKKVTEVLVNSLITSKMDYCNSLLYGLPARQINKLKRVQNAAAKTIVLAKKRQPVTPILRSLHWLPVKYRSQYKLLVITYKILSGSAPAYLTELISEYHPARNLRSSGQRLLRQVACVRTKYGQRAFSNASPVLWNSLPTAIRNAESLIAFKKLLKSHLFIEHFGSG